MRDYLPRNEGELANWARGFATKLAAAPAEYGLSPQTAAAASAAAEDYARAYALALAPATRTKANVAAKNKTRDALLKLLRPLVQQIRANSDVTESLKIALGIRLSGRGPGATGELPALAGRPLLHVAAVEPLRHVLGYGDTQTAGKAKPDGAIGLQVFMHVADNDGDAPPADPLDARFLRFISRQPYAVDFKREQIGKTAYYFARWQTATGETGPWSAVLKMTVAG